VKTDEQWCKDNGVPPNAKFNQLHYGHDTVKLVNGLLKQHGLRVRTKQRPSHGTGSYVWIEKVEGTK
jgi:hypothetical protein